jgi:pSer/pThr/pTyr-binding forkhead associated (FHA) protein
MTDQKETKETDIMGEGATPEPPEDFSGEAVAIPEEIYLEVGQGASKTEIRLKFQKMQLLVGRQPEDDEIGVDMNPYGAFENGVSRRHAAFIRRTEGLFIEDLGSTNGTRINGFTISANKAYRLRNGDEIEFGRLRTKIRMKE